MPLFYTCKFVFLLNVCVRIYVPVVWLFSPHLFRPLASFVSFPLPPMPVYRNFRYAVMLMRCECDDAAATSFLAYLSPLFLSKVLRQHRTEKCWVKGIGKAEGERLVAKRTFGCYCFWMRSLPKLEKNMRTEYTEKNLFCNINKSRYYLA